jgi:hypothetical protein
MRFPLTLTLNILVFLHGPMFNQKAFSQSESLKKVPELIKPILVPGQKENENYSLVKQKIIPNTLTGRTGLDRIKPDQVVKHFLIQRGDKRQTIDSLQIRKINPNWVKSISYTNKSTVLDTALIVFKKRYDKRARIKLDIK